MDGTSNAVITQALDLSIHFPTGETQNLTFFVTLLDQGCTIVLGFCWLTRFNPLVDWVLGCIISRQSSQPETKMSPPVKTLSLAPTLALLNPIPDPETPLPPVNQKPPRVTLINASVLLALANSRIPNVSNCKSLFQNPLVTPWPLPLRSI